MGTMGMQEEKVVNGGDGCGVVGCNSISSKPLGCAESTDYVDLVPCGSAEAGIAFAPEEESACMMVERKRLGDECEAVLDVQDSLVSCVEGVAMQHEHEANSEPSFSLVDRVLPAGSPVLSIREAALIRSQTKQQHQHQVQSGENRLVCSSMSDSNMAEIDIDILNLCGSDDIYDLRFQGIRPLLTPIPDKKYKERESLIKASPVPEGMDEVAAHYKALRCEICFRQVAPNSTSQVRLAKLPCCGQADETSIICSACVILLTQPTSVGSSRVGRCPRCKTWVGVRAHDMDSLSSLDIFPLTQSGTCAHCKQFRSQIVDGGEICDACFLGRRKPLLYECEQCHGTQRIPHPMYRYQPTPEEFSTKTWSCEGPCQFMTHWRLRHDQLVHVPMGDAPWAESDWKAQARQCIREARKELNVDSMPAGSEQCCIL